MLRNMAPHYAAPRRKMLQNSDQTRKKTKNAIRSTLSRTMAVLQAVPCVAFGSTMDLGPFALKGW